MELKDLIRTIQLALFPTDAHPKDDGISPDDGDAIISWAIEKAKSCAPISSVWAEAALAHALKIESEKERRLSIRFIADIAAMGLVRGQVSNHKHYTTLVVNFGRIVDKYGVQEMGKFLDALNCTTYAERFYAMLAIALHEIN